MTIKVSPQARKKLEGTFLHKLKLPELEAKLKESYYGVLANDSTLFNPLENIPTSSKDKFAEYILYLMNDHDYIYFIIKHLLGLESWPAQCVIIKELIEHRFPILIGTRGLSKCVVGDTKVITDHGIQKIKTLVPQDIPHIQQECKFKAYGESKYAPIEYSFFSGYKDTKIITTKNGRKIECTLNHPLRATRGTAIEWVNAENLQIGDVLPIMMNVKPWEKYNNLEKEDAYNLGYNFRNHWTPEKIFGCAQNVLKSYISGFFDAYGEVYNTKIEIIYRQSIDPLRDIQFFLTIFGINSKVVEVDESEFILTIQNKSHMNLFNEKVGFSLFKKKKDLSGVLEDFKGKNTESIPVDLLKDRILKLNHRLSDMKCLTYDRLNEIIKDIEKNFYLSKVKEIYELRDFYDKKYIYDEIVSIENGNAKTYDVHLDSKDHSFNTNGFISHNSFSLAVFLFIKMILEPGSKCIITSAGFRQAKVVFDYMETIWKKSEILRSCFKGDKNGPVHGTDVWTFRVGDSITYALPVGPDGSKIRGYRANCLISEEYATINRQIFEEVMSGFLSVAPSPVEQIQNSATKNTMRMLSIPTSSIDDDFSKNQLILSGTASYKVNHFYDYFKKWHEIIDTKGDKKGLIKLVGEEYYKDINWKDYSIIRIPVDLTAGGYMDMAQVARIKASTTKDVYMREYGAVFSDDSEGFFRKTLIDSCTIQDLKNPNAFAPMLYGDKTKKYIIGVDPAYQGDNFAIVILEINPNHRRIVYSWTTQSSDHKEKIKRGVVEETDYYHYCARKIRQLMKRFPTEYIALDIEGGGRAIVEAFMDISKLKEGESVILPMIEPLEKAKDTDMMQGLHIIKTIKFNSQWLGEANHQLKKDMEDKSIMFPFSDALSYTFSEFYDEHMGKNKELFDNLEDCIYEIDELKKELTTIVVTETATGKEKFDTPSIKTGIQRKGKLKKDRYSALLMANWVARFILEEENMFINPDTRNLSGFEPIGRNEGALYSGNAKIAKKMQDLYKYL